MTQLAQDYEARLARIAQEKAFERRIVERCKALMAPVLDVTRFEARIVLYPKQRRNDRSDC